MPPALGFLFAPLVIGGVSTGVTLAGVLGTAALSGLSYALNAKAAARGGLEDQGIKAVSRSAAPIGRLIVGEALVGGDLFFIRAQNPYLYYGIVLAAHEIEGVREVRIGNKNVEIGSGGWATAKPWHNGTKSFLKVSIRKGTDTQTIDPILAADFPDLPSTFRQRGCATIVLKMDYGANATERESVWGNQQPQPLFLVRGAKVYDPRDPAQDSATRSTWKWSQNASLIQAWWMTHEFGGQRSWDQIDKSALAESAANDDRDIPLKDGGTVPRWSANGVALLNEEPFDILQKLLTANMGQMIWRNGTYIISSGMERFAVHTVNDNAIRGDIFVRYDRPRRDLVNRVETVFTAPDREYQTANGPILEDLALQAADGQQHAATLQLPFTAHHAIAQRLAKAALNTSRRGRIVKTALDFRALRYSAGDILNLETKVVSGASGTYRLVSRKLLENFEWDCELEEWDNDILSWTPATDEQEFKLDLEAA